MSLEPSAVLLQISDAAASLSRQRLVLAYSGGLDSTVLLHLLAGQSTLPLRAVHVDHRLQGEQPQWRQHVEQACAALGVDLQIHELAQRPGQGDSIEAWAREARYAALVGSLRGDELLLLAQHQDDQAETLMLQLLRGAGPAGLAAMPALALRDGHAIMRPLLQLPQAALRGYAERHGIRWFDDPSNADPRFDRNYLRQDVMPAIQARWPSAGKTLGRAAALQADALRLMSQQAAADARLVGLAHGRLSAERLCRLPAERQANVLRFALSWAGLPLPSSRRLASVLSLAASVSGRGEVRWPGASVRRYRDGVFLMPPLAPAPDGRLELLADANGGVDLPGDLGRLTLALPAALPAALLRCRFRRGGERVRALPGGPSISLAQWFQAQDVPPWQRERMPMLFAGEALIAVGEQVVSGDCPEARGLQVTWHRGGHEAPRTGRR